MELKDAFRPSALISELFFPRLGDRGVVAGAVARIADEGFYEGVEVATIDDAEERRRIGGIVRERGLLLNCWTVLVLAAEGLSLCATDATLRRRCVSRLKELMEPAAEMGTLGFGVNSGPDPGPAARDGATDALSDSLCELADALAAFAPMFLMIEPLDRGADKNGLIGPTDECLAFVRRVREHHPTVSITWDTSHVALCGEDLCASLASCRDVIYQMHFANPVTDRASPLCGDTHVPFGPPGLLGPADLAQVIAAAVEAGLAGARRTLVAAEIRTPPGGNPWATEALGRRTLEEAWRIYERLQCGAHDGEA
jgi:sugar phosphate isomerase/epimerase